MIYQTIVILSLVFLGSVYILQDNSSLPVKHFQFTVWPEGSSVPENSSGLIDLIGQVQKWQQSSGNKPITVHCRYLLYEIHMVWCNK